MSSSYVLYNATLQRFVPYPASRMQTLQSARHALHHLTQRQKSCVVLLNANSTQVLAIRVSKQSKHHFPRNYFKNHRALLYVSTGDLVVYSATTGEVVDSFAISEL